MTALYIYSSPVSVSGNSAFWSIFNTIYQRNIQDILIVVPSDQAVQWAIHECRSHVNQWSQSPTILALTDQDRLVSSASSHQAWLAVAYDYCLAQRWKSSDKMVRTAGFKRQFLQWIQQMRATGYRWDDYIKAWPSSQRAQARQWVTWAQDCESLAARWARSETQRSTLDWDCTWLNGATWVVWMGFTQFDPPTLSALNQCIEQSPSCAVCIPESELDTIQSLAWPATHLSDSLSETHRLGLYQFKDPEQEVQFWCDQITAYIQAGGSMADWGILVPDQGPYLALLQRKAYQSNIVLAHAPPCPLHAWFHHWVLCVNSGFDREAVLAFLMHHISQRVTCPEWIGLDISIIDAVAADHYVTSGFDQWDRAFEQALEQCISLAESSTVDRPEFYADYAKKINAQRQLIAHIYRYWTSFQTRQSPDKTWQLFQDFCQSMDIWPATLTHRSAESVRHAAHFCDTVRSFIMSEIASDRIVSGPEWWSLLSEWVKQRPLPDSSSQPSVAVMSVSQAQYAVRSNWAVCGLSDAHYQRVDDGSICFPAHVATEYGITQRSPYYAMTHWLWHQVTQPLSTVGLSQAMSLDGHPTLSSPLLLDVLKPASINIELVDAQTYDCIKPAMASDAAPTGDKDSDASVSRDWVPNIQKQSPYSAAQLDAYQRCPLQYFYRYGCRLDDHDPLMPSISATQWGVMMHDIFYQFFSQLQEKYQQVTRAVLMHPDTLPLLKKIATDLIAIQSDRSFFWTIKLNTLIGTEDEPGFLSAWLNDIIDQEWELLPTAFEKPMYTTIATSSGQSLRLKGIIDVMFSAGGWVGVMDFKTSSTLPTLTDLKQLYNLQLPIYWLLLSDQESTRQVAAAWYYQCKLPATLQQRLMMIHPDAKNTVIPTKRQRPILMDDQMMAAAKDRLIQLSQLMAKGYYGVDPHLVIDPQAMKRADRACRFCRFKEGCRYPARFDHR